MNLRRILRPGLALLLSLQLMLSSSLTALAAPEWLTSEL